MTTATDLPDHDEPNEEQAAPAVKIDQATGKVTFDALMNKPRRITKVEVSLPDADGGARTATIKLQALPGGQYDKILSEHPPSKAQEAKGETFDRKGFGPALLAACSYEPKLDLDQTTALFANGDWSDGELDNLLTAALVACNAGLNVPFNVGV